MRKVAEASKVAGSRNLLIGGVHRYHKGLTVLRPDLTPLLTKNESMALDQAIAILNDLARNLGIRHYKHKDVL